MLLLYKLSRKPGNERRKKIYTGILIIVGIVFCVVQGRQWMKRAKAGNESFSRKKTAIMAQAQGWGLGRHILAQYPGRSIVIVADLDGMKQFAADFEQGLQEAGVANYRFVNLVLNNNAADHRPKLLFSTFRDFNAATDQAPEAQIVISLVGIPTGELRVNQQKKILLAAQVGPKIDQLAAKLDSGKLSGAISLNPEQGRISTPDFPEDSESAFRHFFILQISQKKGSE